ncbi:MAG: phosphoglucosamine mutase [Planctomycetes bacterium]|nr:phosphoglucosamine mutase [Planctomycetota bacterium]
MGKIFGTDGIRDIVNHGFLKPAFLDKLGRVIGSNIPAGRRASKVIIGRDTRPSGAKIEKILSDALASVGVNVDSAGVISTPGLAYLAKCGEYAVGIMISASHNPSSYNGLKLFSANGLKITNSTEEKMEQQIRSGLKKRIVKPGVFSAMVKPELTQRYINDIPRIILSSKVSILSPRTKIVLDCANGALAEIAPAIFSRTGATIIPINHRADGENINSRCGSLHPQTLRRKVLAAKAHIGFSFDGDGDRVIMVDEKGDIRDGDFVLYIAAGYLKKRGFLRNNTVVGTIMTNSALESTLGKQGVRLVRTRVGDKYVLDEMLKNGFSVGGEPSGHIIFRDYSKNGDGVITALMMLKIMADEGKTLWQLSKGFTQYPQIIVNVPVASKPTLEDIKSVKQEADRIHKLLRNQGRLVLRYSGTENLCRVMIEGRNFPYIKALADKLAVIIKKEIG